MKTIDDIFKDKLLNFSVSAVYVYDLIKGLNVFFNQEYTKLTGYTLKYINSLSKEEFHNFFHPDDHISISNHMAELIRSKKDEFLEIEYRFKKADGTWMWCRSKDSGFDYDETGKVTQLIGSFIDITQEKIKEEETYQLNQRLTLAIEATSMLVFETKLDVDKIDWVGNVSEVYKCSIDKINTFSKWIKFVFPEDVKIILDAIDTVTKTNTKHSYVYRIKDGNNNKRYIGASIMPIFCNSEKEIRYIGTNRDITDKIKKDKLLAKSKKKALKLSKRIIKDRERLQYYLDTMPSCILLLNFDGSIGLVNESACTIFGYSKEEMIGESFLTKFIPERLIDKTILSFQKIMSGEMGLDMGEDKYYENHILCKDGSERLIAWRNSFLFDELGNISGSISSGEDITERSRIEEKTHILKELAEAVNQANNLDDVLEYTVDSLCKFTKWPVGHIYFPKNDGSEIIEPSSIWNSSLQADYKVFQEITRNSIFSIGMGLPGLCWKEKKIIWDRDFELKEEYPRKKEAISCGLKGAYAIPIVINNEVNFVIEFFYKRTKDEDITLLEGFVSELQFQLKSLIERERINRELNLAKDSAEQANKAKSTFLANMSHEIRTPMNAILGHAQILNRDENITKDQQKSIDIINRSGQHLLYLINEVLNMSKIEMGKMELYFSTFSLNNLLQELIEMFQFDLKKKGLSLRIENLVKIPKIIKADQNKVRQILINLIANALKFTKEGGVLIQTDFKENTIYVTVSDTGIGILKDNLDRIFGAFVQTENGVVREGTGLGLPISKKMAQLMDGDIRVKSEKGKGSQFTFFFPYLAGEKNTITPINSFKSVARIKEGQKEYKVLIVDDNAANRSLLKMFLNMIGFKVEFADNGIDGIEQFKKCNPDVILMDMVMPVMDGITATKEIRKLNEGKDVGIIMISASAFEDEKLAALDAGANYFVNKPYSESELLERIRACINVEYKYNEAKSIVEASIDSSSKINLTSNLTKKQRLQFIKAIEEGDLEQIESLSLKLKSKNIEFYTLIQQRLESMELEELLNIF